MKMKKFIFVSAICTVLLSAVTIGTIAGKGQIFASGTGGDSAGSLPVIEKASSRSSLNLSDERITLFIDSKPYDENLIEVDLCTLSEKEWEYDTICLRFEYDPRLKFIEGSDNVMYYAGESYVQALRSSGVPISTQKRNNVFASFIFELPEDTNPDDVFEFRWSDEDNYSFFLMNTDEQGYEQLNYAHEYAGNSVRITGKTEISD